MLERAAGWFSRLIGRDRGKPVGDDTVPPVAPDAPVEVTDPADPDLGQVTNGVLMGRDGWLFLWSGSNDVHRYYTEPDYFSDADAAAWADLLAARSDRLAAQGARYLHLTVPDKISLYPERIPVPLPHFDRHPVASILRAGQGRDIPFLDLRPALTGPDKDENFFLTDSHWRHAGCRAAYQAILAALDLQDHQQDFSDRRVGSKRMALDLGGKFQPPILETAEFCHALKTARRVHANHMIVYNETEGLKAGKPHFVGCQTIHRNDTPGIAPQKLVLFGDSFSEFRPHLLTAMLAETFAEVHFVWSTSLDYDYLQQVAPDIVITEIAERFSGRLPTDDFTVDTRAAV